ncbi:glycerate kinase [Oryzobacter sp. R7]|uniref:glycerate kinase family protein n=1 Tax=Oryzobacter faecalis TaxID=3388656 RepID=UPI00398D1D4E
MARTRVLLAPDSFKRSLTSAEVAAALAEGLRSHPAPPEVRSRPLADGGEGSVDAAVAAGFSPEEVEVPGPTGAPVRAAVAWRGDTVVVEVANTCGPTLLPGGRPDPLGASSQGVGLALRQVLTRRPRRVVLALGGSASTDGGLGMLEALGAVDDGGRLDVGPAVASLGGVDLVLATDVDNPLLGPRGAAPVFAPQKGADGATVDLLARRLDALVSRAESAVTGARVLAAAPGAGAAGGTAWAGLLLGGRVVPGAGWFLDLLDLGGVLDGCDLVVTGEGRLDEQTPGGKLPWAVAGRARARGVPVELVVGRCDLAEEVWRAAGIRAVHVLGDLTDRDPSRDSALTARLLAAVGRSIADRLSLP